MCVCVFGLLVRRHAGGHCRAGLTAVCVESCACVRAFSFLPCACHGCLFCVCCAAARIGLSVSVRSGGVGVSTGVALREKERGMSGGAGRGETGRGHARWEGGAGFKKAEYPETDFFTLAMLLFRVAGLAKNSSRQVFCFSYSFIPFYGLSTINCSVSEEQATSANQLAVYYQVLCPCLLHS